MQQNGDFFTLYVCKKFPEGCGKMKKFIIAFFVIVLALAFCSCEVSEPVAEEPVQGEEISSSEEKISSEPELESNGKNAGIEADLIKYAENNHLLEEIGISAKAADVIINDDGTLSFELAVSNGKNEIKLDINGFYLFHDNYGTNYNWGGYSLVNNEYLAVCGINRLFLINIEDFSLLDIDFELDSLKTPGFDQWIKGVAYDEKTGWIVSVSYGKAGMLSEETNVWKIFVFDENGKEIKTYLPTAEASAGGWAGYSVPSVAWKCGVIEKDGKDYYSFGGTSYCVSTGETYRGYSTSSPYDAKTKDYSLYFYQCSNVSRTSKENPYGEDLGFYAVLKDNKENILAFFPTDENYIETTWDDETGEQTLELLHRGGLSFVLVNSYLAKSMELDFEKEEYSVSYNYTDKNLIEHTETSADGKYSLWQAGVQAGGEAYFYEVALKNNETGEIRRIEANGTNQGTFSYEGFLRNGDFYIFNSRKLKIYDPETVELVFDLEKNFSLENRMLYTFRRNPEDMSFIIVYSDYIKGGEYDEESWPWIAPYTIKIGYFDKDGNLLESFDSGIKARYGHFGLEAIEMRYSEDKLVFVTSGGKGFNGIEFTFDRKTETFYEPTEIQ